MIHDHHTEMCYHVIEVITLGRKKTGITLKCLKCDKEFYITKSRAERGVAKFCSLSCGMTFRNETDNPAWREEVRRKISENHADFSGENNPMYGRRGKDCTSYKHGLSGLAKRGLGKHKEAYRILAETNLVEICHYCGTTENLDVHHKDADRKNNDIDNLMWVCEKCHYNKAHTYVRDEYGRFTGEVITNTKKE